MNSGDEVEEVSAGPLKTTVEASSDSVADDNTEIDDRIVDPTFASEADEFMPLSGEFVLLRGGSLVA